MLLLDARVYEWMFNIPAAKMRGCRDEFNRLMIEDGSCFQFTSTDIVVWQHHGYLFHFFQSISGCEDPLLLNMNSSDQMPVKSDFRLTDRFMSCFKQYLAK